MFGEYLAETNLQPIRMRGRRKNLGKSNCWKSAEHGKAHSPSPAVHWWESDVLIRLDLENRSSSPYQFWQ